MASNGSQNAKRKAIMMLPYRQTSGLFLRGGQYYADVRTDDGRRFRRRFGTDRTRALRLFDELRDEIEHGGENPLLVDFLTKRFLPTQERLKAFAFSEKCVNGVIRFVEETEPTLRLRDVRPFHVERLRAHFQPPKYAPRTVNAFQQKLSQALNFAVDLGLLETNPLARVKPLTVDNRRTRFLTMDDFLRILDAARNTDAHDLFLVAGLTGLRPGNVRLLTVGDVQGATLMIPAEKMKNARQGIIPLSRYVANLLAERIASVGEDDDALLFPARGRAERAKGQDNLSRSYRCVVRRLKGLEWSVCYDLRHFFASQLAKLGATEQQIGRLLCHVGQSVTSRYVHQDVDDLRRFVEELSERYLAATGQAEATRIAEARSEATVV